MQFGTTQLYNKTMLERHIDLDHYLIINQAVCFLCVYIYVLCTTGKIPSGRKPPNGKRKETSMLFRENSTDYLYLFMYFISLHSKLNNVPSSARAVALAIFVPVLSRYDCFPFFLECSFFPRFC